SLSHQHLPWLQARRLGFCRECEPSRDQGSRLAASHRRSWRARSVMTSKDGPRCSRGAYKAGCRICLVSSGVEIPHPSRPRRSSASAISLYFVIINTTYPCERANLQSGGVLPRTCRRSRTIVIAADVLTTSIPTPINI